MSFTTTQPHQIASCVHLNAKPALPPSNVSPAVPCTTPQARPACHANNTARHAHPHQFAYNVKQLIKFNKAKDGYTLVNSVCQQCQVANVKTCSSLMNVDTCMAGYWKNGDSCSICREFCVLCTSSYNCLQCQAGYVIQSSSGTYCVACPTGCKTCSNTTTCTQCMWNWRLTNTTCTTITPTCTTIPNCQSCIYSSNNTVTCIICNYPFYISSTGTCIQGTSILCQYASGSNSYQCLNQCSALAYASMTTNSLTNYNNNNINQMICLPKLWIENTGVKQIYFNALYYNRYQNNFLPYNPYALICGNQYLYSGIFSSGTNNLKLFYTFNPYYKLIFYIKYIPIFKSLFNGIMGLNLTVSITDNATNTYSTVYTFGQGQFITCQQEYLTIPSKNIKDQQVTITFSSTLNPSSYNDSQLTAILPNGLLGYRQILIQYYSCNSNCRICSNAEYCQQCYGNLFLSNNICVDNCNGLFEFYLPNGNYLNYTSKYCLQQCPSGYYSTINPIKNATYICLKCPSQCLTCKSATECLSCQAPYLLYSVNFSCLTTCPTTHYPSVSTLQCLACNAPCSTCVNVTQCLSCAIGYFDGQNCVGTCPLGTYSSNTLRKCLLCDAKCSSCQNTPAFCLSCNQPYKLLGTSCLENCPINTYYPYNGSCIACKSPCQLCLSETVCLTCERGYLLNNSCLADCPSGYYKDMGNGKCNICQNNCLTCLSISICQTCVNGTFLYNSICLSSCPIKTYISPSNICIPCIPPCLTCNNETSCITCSLGYLSQVTPNTCVTQCQDGYYGQSTNQTCIECSSNCKTCNQLATFCLTCYSGMLLQNNACVSNCSLGYFAFNNVSCRPCSYPCKTCTGISSKCLTCIDPYILIGSNTCSLQCLSTQYKQNGTCFNCQLPCNSCTDANSCLSCAKNTTNVKYLLNTSCVTSCPSGMYGDGLSLTCKNCVFPCMQCLSSSQCLSCISGYLNVVKKACEICSSTYFPDQVTKTCQLCSSALPNCLQCQSSTVCKVCANGFYLLNTTCISLATCQETVGYYVNTLIKKCSACVAPCSTCINSSYCLNCTTGYLFGGRCPFSCPSTYFANTTFKQCQPCNITICHTCSNSPNQCTSCNPNSTLSVYLAQNKTCISPSNCLPSYYLDNSYGYTQCLKCISPCKTCTNSSYCLSCTSGVLYQGSCSFSCPNKFYPDQNITLGVVFCQQCSNTCLECTMNDTNCISCPVTKLLQDNICVDQCSSGYYLNQYILQCFKCQSPCLYCESATYCNSCQDQTKILYYGQCISQCPQGTYLSNQQCLTCPSQCQLCSFSNFTNTPICDQCASNLFMNSTVYGICQFSCELTQYGDNQTRKCYPCQVPCSQCYTATKCKSCISSYLIYNGQCFKGSQCWPGTFMDPFKEECLDKCYAPYYSDDLTRLCSLECTYNRLKVPIEGNRVCSSTCPTGYYVDDNYACTVCGTQNYNCSDMLQYDIYAKIIFNKLYVKVEFSKQVSTQLISQSNVTVTLQEIDTGKVSRLLLGLRDEYYQKRLLQTDSTNNNNTNNNSTLAISYGFRITQWTPYTLWLQIDTYKTLKQVSISVHFSSYYLLSPTPNQRSPGTNLQQLNSSVLLSSFDQYTLTQQSQGKSFQTYSIILSILLVIVIIASIIGNFLSLFYPLIDYFQILFMMQFLQIDYPPNLNYFLYGFRYSHYLFLPQIFSTSGDDKYYSETPGMFGVVVKNADFLNNTGHDFLIIFIAIGIVGIVKLIDCILSRHIRSNKIGNIQSNCHNEKSDQIIEGGNIHTRNHNNSMISIDKHIQHPQTGSVQQQQQISPKIPTQQLISQQVLQGKFGLIAKYSKIFISRLKWNYFNDICYCIYFYITLFSYSQYYIITQASIVSNVFAVLGFVITLCLPIFFTYVIYKNKRIIQQQSRNNRVFLPFKTFYYFTIPNSAYAMYQIPIRYTRKLIIAILLVYCPQYPQFVLGIIMMFAILNIIMIFIYKPYIVKFENYVQAAIELLFLIGVFIICLMNLQYLNFDTYHKLIISKIVVAVIIILSAVLVVWNIIRFIVQIIKQFCQIDYFINYYQLSQKGQQNNKKKSSILNKNYNQQIHEQSNIRLNSNAFKPNNINSASSFNHESSESYSGLDIYLKKQHDAPPMLIKCIKKFSDQSKSSDQQQQSSDNKSQKDHKSSNIQPENIMMINTVKKMQPVQYEINRNKQHSSSAEKQAQNQSQISKSKQQNCENNHGQQLEIQPHTSEVNKENERVNIFSLDESEEESEDGDKQIQPEKQQNIQCQQPNKLQKANKQQQPLPIYQPRDMKQIFERNRNRDQNKMKTIFQVEDFDIGDSINQKKQSPRKIAISEEYSSSEKEDDQNKKEINKGVDISSDI